MSLTLAGLRPGLSLMLWGFFKKIVIADRLALYVDTVYFIPGQFSGSSFILATIFFAFQIYCDFSAYSDIAIGAAQVMGFKLMTNFNGHISQPVFQNSGNAGIYPYRPGLKIIYTFLSAAIKYLFPGGILIS